MRNSRIKKVVIAGMFLSTVCGACVMNKDEDLEKLKKEYVQDFSSLSKELCATKNKLKNLIVSKGFFLLSKEVNIESLVCDSEDKSSLKVMSDFLYCSWMKKIKEEGKLKEVLKMIDIKY